jgi:DNA-binding response OmpR family regulator
MPSQTTDSTLENASILVIEDNKATADLVYEILDQEGYQVRLALSGEAGLALMSQARADLVLLDVMLPGIDGFETCRQLKAHWGNGVDGSFLPIVMLTARGGTHDVVAGLEAGADEYLRKPFEIDELLLRVRAMLRIVHNERALARRNAELETLATENAILRARAERDLEMKTLLLRELQHRVRNNLQAISGILSFQLTRETTAQAAITGALRRIKSIAATQDFLFKREGGPIPMRPLLEVVAQQLAGLWALPGQSVQVTADQPEVTLSMEQAQVVGIVIHELIANAFQHGLAGRPGIIRLHLETTPVGVAFDITDPGDGFPAGFDMQAVAPAGLKLVQILLEREFRIGLQIHSNPGATRASFTIPRSYFPAGYYSVASSQDRKWSPALKGD